MATYDDSMQWLALYCNNTRQRRVDWEGPWPFPIKSFYRSVGIPESPRRQRHRFCYNQQRSAEAVDILQQSVHSVKGGDLLLLCAFMPLARSFLPMQLISASTVANQTWGSGFLVRGNTQLLLVPPSATNLHYKVHIWMLVLAICQGLLRLYYPNTTV